MTQILGVDFSGAQSDKNTWLTEGTLDGNCLSLKKPHSISRSDLKTKLAKIAGPAVAAMDFPFSVPVEFARFWQPEATTMPELWQAAKGMKLEGFIDNRDEFVASYGEPKRACDPPESYSCLHKVNPNMLPMTFYGMQMLHRLWYGDTANPMLVPPLPEPSRPGGEAVTTLLEVMPGAVLRRLSLPFKGYKGGQQALELRHCIVEKLSSSILLLEVDLFDVRETCLKNHDALDSMVAAVAAALWAKDPSSFRLPCEAGHPYCPALLLEGWLYAPKPQT